MLTISHQFSNSKLLHSSKLYVTLPILHKLRNLINVVWRGEIVSRHFIKNIFYYNDMRNINK